MTATAFDGWADPRGWRHVHVCPCGASTTCSNPACSEPDECPACREAVAADTEDNT